MGNGGDGGVVRLERERRDVLETRAEHRRDGVVGDVEHLDVEHVAVVVDKHRLESVGERGEAELAEEGRRGGGHLLASLDDGHVGEDLDRTLVDLGGDVESLEEVGLRRLHAGGTRRDDDVNLSDGASLGGRGDDELLDLLLDVAHLTGGEDDADVADHLLGEGHPGVVALAFAVLANALADHGVLAHEDSRLGAERLEDAGIERGRQR